MMDVFRYVADSQWAPSGLCISNRLWHRGENTLEEEITGAEKIWLLHTQLQRHFERERKQVSRIWEAVVLWENSHFSWGGWWVERDDPDSRQWIRGRLKGDTFLVADGCLVFFCGGVLKGGEGNSQQCYRKLERKELQWRPHWRWLQKARGGHVPMTVTDIANLTDLFNSRQSLTIDQSSHSS